MKKQFLVMKMDILELKLLANYDIVAEAHHLMIANVVEELFGIPKKETGHWVNNNVKIEIKEEG